MPIYMNLNFANGDSVNSIEIDSFNFGIANTTSSSSGGAGAGKVTVHDITITKHTDKSSPKLLTACETAHLLPAVQITFDEHRSKTPYLTYSLKNVLISSIQWSSGGGNPTESISLAFEQFEVLFAD